MMAKKWMTFEIRVDEIDGSRSILLWVNDTLVIPFDNLEEFRKFANGMLGMIPEIEENL